MNPGGQAGGGDDNNLPRRTAGERKVITYSYDPPSQSPGQSGPSTQTTGQGYSSSMQTSANQLYRHLVRNDANALKIIICSALFSRVTADTVAEFLQQTHGNFAATPGYSIRGDLIRALFWSMWEQDQQHPEIEELMKKTSGLDEAIQEAMNELASFLTQEGGSWSSSGKVERCPNGKILPQWGETLAAEELATEQKLKAEKKAADNRWHANWKST